MSLKRTANASTFQMKKVEHPELLRNLLYAGRFREPQRVSTFRKKTAGGDAAIGTRGMVWAVFCLCSGRVDKNGVQADQTYLST